MPLGFARSLRGKRGTLASKKTRVVFLLKFRVFQELGALIIETLSR